MEIFVLMVLVLVTTYYAIETRRIADATKQQAAASVKMAEEMREQRYSECQPVLIPEIVLQPPEPPNSLYSALQSGVGFKVKWHNSGKGVAINTRFSLWGIPLDSNPNRVLHFPPDQSTAIPLGGTREVVFNWRGTFEQPTSHHPRLEAEYQDIHERNLTTVLVFAFDKGEKKANVGELYFTVNGRRLGQEVKQ